MLTTKVPLAASDTYAKYLSQLSFAKCEVEVGIFRGRGLGVSRPLQNLKSKFKLAFSEKGDGGVGLTIQLGTHLLDTVLYFIDSFQL